MKVTSPSDLLSGAAHLFGSNPGMPHPFGPNTNAMMRGGAQPGAGQHPGSFHQMFNPRMNDFNFAEFAKMKPVGPGALAAPATSPSAQSKGSYSTKNSAFSVVGRGERSPPPRGAPLQEYELHTKPNGGQKKYASNPPYYPEPKANYNDREMAKEHSSRPSHGSNQHGNNQKMTQGSRQSSSPPSSNGKSSNNQNGATEQVPAKNSSGSGNSQSSKPELNPACVPRCSCDELVKVDAKLETKELWEKFHELGTEMIITKTGRR